MQRDKRWGKKGHQRQGNPPLSSKDIIRISEKKGKESRIISVGFSRQGGLIVFYGKKIISLFFFNDIPCRIFLSMEGIESYHTVFDI